MKARALRLVVSMVCAAGMMTACGGQRAEDMLASAKDYLAKKDGKAAVIQLKNALQKNPDLGEARLLLGRALLQSGDAQSAAVELRKALALEQPESQVVPELARALLAGREFRKLIGEFAETDLTDPQATADLKTSLAVAYAADGANDKSAAALRAAFEAAPGYPPALVFQARVQASERNVDKALASLDRALAARPGYAEALQLRGDLLFLGKSDPAGAIAAYRQALAADPAYLPAHTGLIDTLFSQRSTAEAAAQIKQLEAIAPNHPQTLFFEAQLAYINNDFKQADEAIQKVLRVFPNHPKALLLAGALEMRNGQSMLRAQEYLNKAVQAAPALPNARQMLAQTYLRSGQPDKALAALEPLLAGKNVAAETLSLAAEAEMQSGDAKHAEAYLVQAAELDPTQPKNRVALALSRVKGGNVDAAVSEIEAVAASDSGAYADAVLVNLFLRKGELDKALKAAESIEKKEPNKAYAANLRGRVQLLLKNTAEARRGFERALAIDPRFVPAASSLALLDLADKRPDLAKKRFDAVLAADPKNTQALLALAALRARAGGSPDEVAALLADAVKSNPADAPARLALINHHLARNDAKRALTAAQDAVAALPQNAQLLDVLGQVQARAGERNQAINSFNRLTAMQPGSPQPYLRLAGLYVESKEFDQARSQLKRALEASPRSLPVQRALVEVELRAQRPDDALAAARAVRSQRPAEDAGYLLEGAVEASRRNLPAAIDAYRAGLKQAAASTNLAVALSSALRAAGQSAEGEKFDAGWLKAHPKDLTFLWHLGSAALSRNDYATAEGHFRRLDQLQPDNPLTLNNLAWTTARLGKPGAVAYADKAVALAPDNAELLDTLAFALAADKQFAKAIETQKKALALAPEAHGLRLSLAKLYIQAGDKPAARAELDRLAKLEGKFAAQAEVSRLLATL